MAAPNPELVVEHVIRLMGGHEKAFESLDKDFRFVATRWAQDTGTIGRILRAHLFVEYFLGEYLQAKNPSLGQLEDARLSFSQKLALVGTGPAVIANLLPGVRRLNSIRNRLAHTLLAQITKEDADAFLAIDIFRAFREAGAMRKSESDAPSMDPLDVLEDFARFSGSMFHNSVCPNTKVFAEAFQLAEKETSGSD